jgi:hypothetical protein
MQRARHRLSLLEVVNDDKAGNERAIPNLEIKELFP